MKSYHLIYFVICTESVCAVSFTAALGLNGHLNNVKIQQK